jgi:hypothetical protein
MPDNIERNRVLREFVFSVLAAFLRAASPCTNCVYQEHRERLYKYGNFFRSTTGHREGNIVAVNTYWPRQRGEHVQT